MSVSINLVTAGSRLPILALLIAAASVTQGRAQSLAPPTLSLFQVIQETQAHSDQVRQAVDAVKAANARVGQQNAARNPQLSLVGSATQYDAPSSLSFAGTKFVAIPDHLEALTLQLNQLLDFANQVGTAVSQTRLLALASEYTYKATSNDVALTATTAYYDALRAEQNVEVAKATLASYQEQLKLNTKLYQGGTGPKINVYRAESQVADADSDLVQRQNQSRSARSRLDDLIGRPLDAEFLLVDPTKEPGSEHSPSLDRLALINQALSHRSEVLGAAVQSRAAEKGIKLARSSTDPQVSIGLAGNYYPTTSFQYIRETTAALTLGVTIPIYDGGLARDRVKEATSNLDSAKANENRTKRDIALEVQNAAFDVETAVKRRDAAKVAVVAASAAKDLAQQRFEAQVSVYLEVTDAQSALTAAQASLVNSTFDLLSAQARLSRALGEPILK